MIRSSSNVFLSNQRQRNRTNPVSLRQIKHNASLRCNSPKALSPAAPNPNTPRSGLVRGAPLLLLQFGLLSAPSGSSANILEDVARQVLRPDLTLQEAVVQLLDASSTLKDLAELAATPLDSEIRFKSRFILPALASRLRPVGAATPVVAQVVTGTSNKEATLGTYYGGQASTGSQATDKVYDAMGRVLTISGRTIRIEAQEGPDRALAAKAAIDELLAQVPGDALQAAQQARVQRGNGAQ